ncbi:MAG: LEA type 2 family protein [Bdellovibrionaceae bacterium]|nr:LEA type 2 family protein [Pseudobdellovibrionaceae bacterium]
MFTRSLTLLWIMANFILSGCSSFVEAVLEKPKVQFHSVQVRDAVADGATAVIALDVENPNGVSLTVDRMTYALELGGKPVAQAEVKEFATLKAREVSRVEIPVPFKYGAIFSSVLDLLRNGTAAYKVMGEARIGIFTLPFQHAGDVKLRP